MFVFTFNENSGLNHIIFLLRFFFSDVSQSVVLGLYIKVSLTPLLLRASEYLGIELIKTFLSDEMSDICLAIYFGSCFRTTVRWLDFC